MKRLIVRAWLLVIVGSLAVSLASVAWSYFGGEGTGSVDVALAVPSGCPSSDQVDAHGLPYTDGPTATCSGSTLDFGIPAGAPGQDGADGTAGATGPPGADSTVPGPTGPAGPTGPTGATGQAGQSITSAPATDCNGTGRPGSFFNGVSGGTWACDGATGPQGPQGATGATGSQGPQGQTGATGAQGPAGSPGISGFTLVDVVVTCTTANSVCRGTASCAGGRVVIAGGWYVSGSDPTATSQVPLELQAQKVSSNTAFQVGTWQTVGRNIVVWANCGFVP